MSRIFAAPPALHALKSRATNTDFYGSQSALTSADVSHLMRFAVKLEFHGWSVHFPRVGGTPGKAFVDLAFTKPGYKPITITLPLNLTTSTRTRTKKTKKRRGGKSSNNTGARSQSPSVSQSRSRSPSMSRSSSRSPSRSPSRSASASRSRSPSPSADSRTGGNTYDDLEAIMIHEAATMTQSFFRNMVNRALRNREITRQQANELLGSAWFETLAASGGGHKSRRGGGSSRSDRSYSRSRSPTSAPSASASASASVKKVKSPETGAMIRVGGPTYNRIFGKEETAARVGGKPRSHKQKKKRTRKQQKKTPAYFRKIKAAAQRSVSEKNRNRPSPTMSATLAHAQGIKTMMGNSGKRYWIQMRSNNSVFWSPKKP